MAWLERRWPALSLWWLLATVAAQDQASCSVHGRVFDEDGKPIAGGAVSLFADSDFVDTATMLAAPTIATNAEGSYVLTVDVRFPHGLVVIAAKGRQACAFWLRRDPTHLDVAMPDAVLPPGAQLAGRVRGEDGMGLGGVRVRVETGFADRGGSAGRLLSGATSDAHGIFAVPCVPRTGLRVIVQADGYLARSLLVAQQSPLDLTLQKIGVVRGTVVDAAGAPVAGVQVSGVTVEAHEGRETAISSTDGSFAIPVPTRGRFRVAG
jgi:hypothetical protein